MDRAEFHAALSDMEPYDEEGLVTAIQRRVRTLSNRHLDIQDRIDDTEATRRDLEERLADAEGQIIEQADASVEADIESIEDIEALPEDVSVEFDPALLAEVRDIREQARSNYQRTAEEGADLQTELSTNSEELQLHQDVLADLEAGNLSVPQARDRLLDFFDDSPDDDTGAVDLSTPGADDQGDGDDVEGDDPDGGDVDG